MRLRQRDYIFVGIQFLLFLLYYFDVGILQLSFPDFVQDIALVFSGIGSLLILIAMLQLKKNLSPFPTPKADGELIQSGLYKYVRHPIYSGILVALGSFSIYSNSGYRVLLCILLYILFSMKTRYEERQLREKFREYADYRSRTGCFFPKIKSGK